MHRALAHLLYIAIAAFTRLPWPWLRALADALAARTLDRRARAARIALRNLELAYPELLPAQQAVLQASILRTAARQTLETLRVWTRAPTVNLACITEQHGVDLFDAAIAARRGVIVAAPHYGNWELLNQWLASRTAIAILYAPPDSPVANAFLNRVRAAQADASRVVQVRAEAAGVRQLFKWLQGGGVAGILPDQQPKQGEGEFAPFFDRPALTMSLLGRLAARTRATVLMAYCERIADTSTGPRFALRIEAAPAEVADSEPQVAVAALNRAVERIARRDPAQYQWTYKRFTLQPDGGNPYWPDCY